MTSTRSLWLLAPTLLALVPLVLSHGGGHAPPAPRPPVSTPPPQPAGGGYGGPGDTTPGGPSAPGPAGPSTPGPSAPSAPGPGRPRPTPAASPPPPAPGPSGGGPPATGIGAGFDVSEWRGWWGVNQHEFLRLKDAVWSGGVESDALGFAIGQGQDRGRVTPRRPSPDLIAAQVVPALFKALEGERQPGVLSGCLTALAKLGPLGEGAEPAVRKELEAQRVAALLRYARHPNQQLSETAVLCLGLLGDPGQLGTLSAIAGDEQAGRELTGSSRVTVRTRAFAAYGLGVLAERDRRADVQRFSTHALSNLIEDDESGSPDISVACVNALSLVELPEQEGDEVDASGPAAASRAALVASLMGLLRDRRSEDVVRAQVPRALARAVGSAPSELRELVAEELLELLARNKRLDATMRVGVVQALGQLGTAGDARLDVRIRAGLRQAVSRGDMATRNHALIALASVGGRPGVEGDEAWSGAREVTSTLLEQLARGKSRSRPWAALALGVQGFYLRDQGLSPSSDVSLALRSELEDCGSPQDMGAYALALGLRGDVGAAGLVRSKLERVNEDATRGELAIALGLMRDQASVERLRELLPEARYRPQLIRSLAIGLALLGDSSLVQSLVRLLEESDSSSLKAVYAWTLAYVGDNRAVEPLIALLGDPEVPDLTRGIAALGLGWTCESVRLPWNTRLARDANLMRAPATYFNAGGGGVLNIR